MQRLTLILLIVILLEAVACGTVVMRKMLRVDPVLPPVQWDDPIIEEEIIEVAEQARTGDSKDWQLLGEALLGQGFYSYSEIAFRQALKLDPQNHVARFNLAFCLDRTGRTEASSQEYKQVSRFRTQSGLLGKLGVRSQYAIGCNFLRDEQPTQAEQAFRKLPNDLRAQYQIAKLQVRSGNAAQALPAIESMLKIYPMSMAALFLQYRAAKALDHQQTAIQAADKLERSTERIALHFNTDLVGPFHARYGLERMIRDYNRQILSKDMDRLAETLSTILSHVHQLRSPYTRLALTSLMEVELQRKNPERMQDLVQQLKDFGERNADMLQFEGAAQAYQGNMQQAAELWQRANRMSPNIQFSLHLAEYYESQNDLKKRDEAIAESLLMGAMDQFRKNQLQPAQQLLEKSLESNPRNAQTWFYKAETLRALGSREEAIEAYQRCLELNPNHGRAIVHLKQLQQESPPA